MPIGKRLRKVKEEALEKKRWIWGSVPIEPREFSMVIYKGRVGLCRKSLAPMRPKAGAAIVQA